MEVGVDEVNMGFTLLLHMDPYITPRRREVEEDMVMEVMLEGEEEVRKTESVLSFYFFNDQILCVLAAMLIRLSLNLTNSQLSLMDELSLAYNIVPLLECVPCNMNAIVNRLAEYLVMMIEAWFTCLMSQDISEFSCISCVF